jgi:hypothetical protein
LPLTGDKAAVIFILAAVSIARIVELGFVGRGIAQLGWLTFVSGSNEFGERDSLTGNRLLIATLDFVVDFLTVHGAPGFPFRGRRPWWWL